MLLSILVVAVLASLWSRQCFIKWTLNSDSCHVFQVIEYAGIREGTKMVSLLQLASPTLQCVGTESTALVF
jgi:hypothetical protein